MEKLKIKHETPDFENVAVPTTPKGRKRKIIGDKSETGLKKAKVKTEVSNKTKIKNEKQTCKSFIKEEAIVSSENHQHWVVEDIVSEKLKIEGWIVGNVVQLLNDDCTIPFIARYRKHMTGGLEAEKLREISETVELLKSVQKKAESSVQTLKKENKLTPQLETSLYACKTLLEVDHVFAPFKTGSKKTLASRARELGLEEPGLKIFNGTSTLLTMDVNTFIKPEVKGLKNNQEVLQGLQHIIADAFSKDRAVLDTVTKLCHNGDVELTCTKSNTSKKIDEEAKERGKTTQTFKFENYFNFKCLVRFLKPHQTLAINRGENLKILTVKVVIPDWIKKRTKEFCFEKWMKNCQVQSHASLHQTKELIDASIEDSYNRLMEPHMVRQLRSELTKQAEKESIAVFSKNLKQLLLTPPVRGKIILSIDPGFKNGCKTAVLSPLGTVLETAVFNLNSLNSYKFNGVEIVKNLIIKHRCEIIAIGNGTACRETEDFISKIIKEPALASFDIKYCIINESGASIYSVTKDSEAEFPGMDPNLRSAVCIGRRLQDPLLEYVKVDPKHLGVGMYQHDVSENQLKSALESVVIECVSFVGIDLNVCPEVILRKIAGLTAARAKAIIDYRKKCGSFKNRSQLLQVKGLGPKSYEQCAGFVKIMPQTAVTSSDIIKLEKVPKRTKKKLEITEELNPLDMTVIHPESYLIAEKFLQEINCKKEDIGKSDFIKKVKGASWQKSMAAWGEILGTDEMTCKLIMDALQQSVDYDIRSEFEKPLFRKSLGSINSLAVGTVLTGKVMNTTHFGAFVDIGVGQDGLIHVSQMGKIGQSRPVALGDKVEVKVVRLEKEKRRIGLQLLKYL